ncbi:MAG: UvrD-helicase domain-containing protein, partial [Phascolarctobacterium sp.]|nr:UvrD-helicase domain-containing protein [Phascolarctobacterium sp.]
LSEDMDYEAFKEECIRDFLRRELRSEEENSTKYLVSILGAGTLYNQLSSLVEDLEDIAAEDDLVAPYKDSEALLQDKLNELLDKLTWMAENRDELMKKSTKAYQALEELGSDLPLIEEQLEAEPCDLSLVDTHLAMRPSGKLTPFVNEARELSKDIKSYLVDKAAVPVMEHWRSLIKGLNDYIKEQKKVENILTYDDLETKAIELLANNEEIRHKYHKKIQHFMVDEFQDTNDKQCALIYLLCGDSECELEGNKLFVVGDPKQSIYRFNGADVDVFERVVGQIKATGGENISMKTNFRSKDKILDCCNETFARIMGTAGSTVKFEALDCADFNMNHPVLPELISVDPEDPEARTVELYAVAQKIKALADAELASENHTEDSKVYGEMAVLLRTMTRVNDLTQVLAEYQIPYVVIDGKGFFQRQEICDIINLWDVIHNPYQNIPLAGILKSPYFAFDDELLTKIGLKDKYLWNALQVPSEAFKADLNNVQLLTLETALERFKSIMESIRFLDADAAWAKLWNIFGMEVVLSLQNNGKQKLANVQKLRKLSLDYCHENSVGIADWLTYVKDAMAMGAEETNANLDATDAV